MAEVPKGQYVSAAEAEQLMRDAALARQQAEMRRRAAQQSAQGRTPYGAQAPRRAQSAAPTYHPSRHSRPAQAPVSAPQSKAERQGTEGHFSGTRPNRNVPTATPERRRLRKGVVFVGVVAVVGTGVFVAAKNGLLEGVPVAGQYLDGTLDTSNSGIAVTGNIETVGPEGLTLENCQGEGAAVATINITGRYPLAYILKSPDGTTDVPIEPYLKDDTDDYVDTVSGYPELILNDFPIKIYACRNDNPGVTAVEQSGENYMIDFNAIDLKASLPEELSAEPIVTNTELNSSSDSLLQWPASPFIASKPELYSDESLNAVVAAHTTLDENKKNPQLIATLNAAVDTVLQMAVQASPESTFNQTCQFSDGATNTAQIVREGIARRIVGNSERAGFANAISNLGGTVYKKDPPALTEVNPELSERFVIDSCEVAVGDSSETQEAPEPGDVQAGDKS